MLRGETHHCHETDLWRGTRRMGSAADAQAEAAAAAAATTARGSDKGQQTAHSAGSCPCDLAGPPTCSLVLTLLVACCFRRVCGRCVCCVQEAAGAAAIITDITADGEGEDTVEDGDTEGDGEGGITEGVRTTLLQRHYRSLLALAIRAPSRLQSRSHAPLSAVDVSRKTSD